MYEPQAKKTIRDTIRDTFTPSRVGLLSWAFAAAVMGTAGLASYQFGALTLKNSTSISGGAGLPLPPLGDVTTTASIGTGSQGANIEVLHLPERGSSKAEDTLEQGKIAVLQEQVVRLHRRLSALSEQNTAYSRRIAALENAVSTLNSSDINTPGQTRSLADPVVPTRGVVVSQPDGQTKLKRPLGPQPKPHLTAGQSVATRSKSGQSAPDAAVQSLPTLPAPETAKSSENNPRRISLNTGQQSEPELSSAKVQEPVRIVTLPQPTQAPVITGSINPESRVSPPGIFDSTPTSTNVQPKIIVPSEAVGRLRGNGKSVLKNSDFGAVVGHFQSIAEATNAWARFKEQNVERMRDLRPLITQRKSVDGGVSLLVGPFGNAADAAMACLRLLEVTEFCHPALFAGSPLVAAADFRETAF